MVKNIEAMNCFIQNESPPNQAGGREEGEGRRGQRGGGEKQWTSWTRDYM